MDIVIEIVGIIIVALAVVYLLKPEVMKYLMAFFKKGRRMYFAGLIRLALAVLFFSSYRECDKSWIIFAFGIVFLISGLLIFILGLERLKSMFDWYQKQSAVIFRVIALVALAFGVVIIYAA